MPKKNIKKILITGSTGFIGKNLWGYLSKRNYKVYTLSRRDLQNKQVIENAVKNCDAIVHLAAVINALDKDIWQVNVELTNLLVGAAKKYAVKKFIFLSTENVLQSIKDPYTESKRKAEQIVKTLDRYIILRPTLVYGPHDNKYLTKIILLIKKFSFVPVFGNGKNKMQFLYVKDVTKVIEKCINSDIIGTYLVAGPEPMEYNKIISIIGKKLNKKPLKIHIPYTLLKLAAAICQMLFIPFPVNSFQLNNFKKDRNYPKKEIIKIAKIFGYNPTPFERGIKETISSLKNRKK